MSLRLRLLHVLLLPLTLVVGAYAVSIHAEPRGTGDLDIWVEASAENAPRVYEALRSFGAPLHEISVADLQTPEVVFQIGLPPRRIDILTSITGVTFAAAWQDRIETTYEGVLFPVIGRRALLVNKRALGRPRDLADIDLLERFEKG